MLVKKLNLTGEGSGCSRGQTGSGRVKRGAGGISGEFGYREQQLGGEVSQG